MGSRAQVLVKNGDKPGVYLYTHWGSPELPEQIRKALAKRWRWDDPEYLARIIFDEMKGGDLGETGYGIGVYPHDDLEYPPIIVNTETQEVTLTTSEQPITLPFSKFVAAAEGVPS